jgi:YD repeat-containing protein
MILPQRSHSERTFELQTNGSYQGQIDDKGVLTKEGESYRLKEKNGTIIVFRADGQLNYVENANGYRLLAGYTNDRLTSITASNGDSFTFSYNTQGRISSVTDRAGETVTYKYDSTGRFLIAIENSTGTTSLTYGHPYEPMALTSITYADGSKITYDYDDFGRIQQVILGEGRQALAYTYAYDANGGVTVTDPSGAITQISRNNQG